MDRNTIDTDILQRVLGRELKPEEEFEIDLYNRGCALRTITPTPGYDEILNLLRSYVGGAVEELVATSPARRDDVAARHAVTFALTELYNKFVNDVNEAVAFAQKPPKVVLEQLKHHTSGPPPGI